MPAREPPCPQMRGWALLLPLLAALPGARGSAGDRDPEFLRCEGQCRRSCAEAELPLALRLTFWDCRGDCAYRCAFEVDAARRKKGLAQLQYFGCWAFRRVMGSHEVVSAALSLATVAAHIAGVRRLLRCPSSQLRTTLATDGVLWACSAAASVLWHSRHLELLERLDYAAVALAFAHHSVAVAALLGVLRGPSAGRRASAAAVAAWAAFQWYCTRGPGYDYSFNMAAVVVVGAVQAVGKSLWALGARPDGWAWLVASTAAAAAAGVFDALLDFPPFGGLVDAHAVFHLFGAAAALLWYPFAAGHLCSPRGAAPGAQPCGPAEGPPRKAA
eukprot:TRINITY_DN14406_c0_g2_i2.p1 TRINITY_DN14406_c0_g2~~TRINITY_DN14406_c0_g2_i2.p1  ORF type:complete len:330 (+),score=87.38 TRINITY_DN14406_c0_g2_i2:78-1067(+)